MTVVVNIRKGQTDMPDKGEHKTLTKKYETCLSYWKLSYNFTSNIKACLDYPYHI